MDSAITRDVLHGQRFPSWPVHDSREADLLLQVLNSAGWWRGSGSQVSALETAFAAAHGALHGLAVTNGTNALELALRTLKIGPGDEVIVPAMTFVATVMPVLTVGATPIVVDVDPVTWCIDIDATQDSITQKTRAVIPVHFAGHIADMSRLTSICESRGISIIEDACHAHGARWEGKPAGSFGVMSVFSFQNFKLMTAGEGGMLLVNNKKIYEEAVLYGNCGRPFGDKDYLHLVLGSNCRMSEFQAAVLNAQLERLETLANRREQASAALRRLLSDVEGIQLQGRDQRVDRHSYYMFCFNYEARSFGGLPRDEFVRLLVDRGVPAYRMYPNIPETAFFPEAMAKIKGDLLLPSCSVSSRISKTGVWLHHRVLLAEEHTLEWIRCVIEDIRRDTR